LEYGAGKVAWFGDEIVQDILVDPTPVYHGTSQNIDSTSLLTNRVVDSPSTPTA